MFNRLIIRLVVLLMLAYASSASARYLSPDPIGLNGGNNLYQYGNANPLRYSDPSGLVPNPAEAACVLGPNGVCIAGVFTDVFTDAAAMAAAVTAANQAAKAAKETCKDDKPCDPPEGTVCFFIDRVPPSKPHFPIEGSHYHLFQMNRSPNGCFWNPIGASRSAPPGAIACPFTRAGGR